MTTLADLMNEADRVEEELLASIDILDSRTFCDLTDRMNHIQDWINDQYCLKDDPDYFKKLNRKPTPTVMPNTCRYILCNKWIKDEETHCSPLCARRDKESGV